MRVRWRGAAVTSTSSPRRWCGAGAGDPRRRRTCPDAAARSAARSARACSGGCGRSSTDGSFLLGPSTSTSSTRPMRASVLGQRGALDHDPQPLEPLGHHVGRRRSASAMLGRLGAGPGREDERVGAVVLGRGHDLERALEVVVGLAGEADDEVGGDGEVGDGGAGRGEPLEVALGGVAAVHRAPACGRCPTAAAGAGARTPPASRPWPRSSRARRSFGCGLREADARMPSTAPTRAQQVGEQRRAVLRRRRGRGRRS